MKRFPCSYPVAAGILVALGGCQSTMKDIGREPAMTAPDSSYAIGIPPGVVAANSSEPVNAHSTWTDSASFLFASKRPPVLGDILTVQVSINDNAQVLNKSNRNRNGKKSAGLAGSFDLAGAGSSGKMDASLNNSTDFAGSGGTTRSESINLQIAAVVTSVLANGNLLISGSQEVRVNAELRILTITGIVRPSDIQPDNTISYDRIAEARFSYGGRGRISEMQQPAYGQQILDQLSPL
jgi:flagellar L-ring protein FlgH